MRVSRANETDIESLVTLNNRYVAEGLTLPRTEEFAYAHLADYRVIRDADGGVAACAALDEYSPTIVELVSLAAFGLFYDIRFVPQLGPIFLVMALSTWAMTVIGTMFSALTVNLRLRELMLPILVYPFLIPALMAAMLLTTDSMAGKAIWGEDSIWLRVLFAFDFVFTALAVVFIDVVLVG